MMPLTSVAVIKDLLWCGASWDGCAISLPQVVRCVVPGDCFITRSISKEVVPEMVSISVLQHQIPIKHGKFH